MNRRNPKQLANQVKERMDQLERDPKTMQEIEDFQRQFGCVPPQSQSHAEKCPVCHGEGTLEQTASFTTDCSRKTCHGCNGKGWIVIHDYYD